MSKKRVFLLSLSFFCLSVLTGCASDKTHTSTKTKSCLWKVSEGTNTLYVQGSVHMLKAENYPLKPEIVTAYSNSQHIVFETDIDSMKDPAVQALIMTKAMGENLKEVLLPEVYAALETELKKTGLPMVMFTKAKPWFAAMTLVQGKMMNMGMNPMLGLDMYFSGRAKTDGKTQSGLETLEFQVSLLESLSELDPNDFIRLQLKEINTLESDLNNILKYWAEGDLDQLGDLMLEAFKEYPDIQKRFVDDRNVKWALKCKEFMETGQTHMIIVGALHLPGKKGLLALLKKEGYAIEQL